MSTTPTPNPQPLISLPEVYIAGDIHLHGDDEGGAFGRWLDALATRAPARLILLGDLFEYWLETASSETRYAPVLNRLRALRNAGWHIDLILGNRELSAGRRLAAASGANIHWPALDLTLGNRCVRVVHGDRLCYDPGYRFFSAWVRSFWHRTWQVAHPAFVQDAVARFLRRRSHAGNERRSRQISTIKRVFIDRRRVQAAARGADTLIAGHIHQSWRRMIGGVDMILVGDWPAGSGHWIEGYNDGRLERRELLTK